VTTLTGVTTTGGGPRETTSSTEPPSPTNAPGAGPADHGVCGIVGGCVDDAQA
jgi:hypothetical protein